MFWFGIILSVLAFAVESDPLAKRFRKKIHRFSESRRHGVSVVLFIVGIGLTSWEHVAGQPRQLSERQIATFAEVINSQPSVKISIHFRASDPEVTDYVMSLAHDTETMKMRFNYIGSADSYTKLPSGITLNTACAEDQVKLIREALTKAKIPFTERAVTEVRTHSALIIGSKR